MPPDTEKWIANKTGLLVARVSDHSGDYLLFSFDFNADVKSDGARNGRFVRSLFQVVPDVHFAGQSANLGKQGAVKVCPRQ